MPLDGSNEAEKRVDEAISLMKLTKGELILFHVVDVVPLWGHGIEKDYQFRKADSKSMSVRSNPELNMIMEICCVMENVFI